MSVTIHSQEQLLRAKEDYEDLHTAWKKALLAQSYSDGYNELARASLKELRAELDEYEAAIAAYEQNGTTKRRTARFVPLG